MIKDIAIRAIVMLPFMLIIMWWGKKDGYKSGYADGYQARVDYEHGK